MSTVPQFSFKREKKKNNLKLQGGMLTILSGLGQKEEEKEHQTNIHTMDNMFPND